MLGSRLWYKVQTRAGNSAIQSLQSCENRYYPDNYLKGKARKNACVILYSLLPS